MLFRQVARPASGCLAYIVGDEAAGEALAIDPPREVELVLGPLRASGLRLTQVLETHTHADHYSGARPLAQGSGARLLLPARSRAQFPHEAIADGAELRVGDLRMRALHTPGHTPDAMSFVLEDRAIVGDTLLVGTPGRADFYEQGPEELYHTIFDKLLKLRDEVLVYPAHSGPKHGLPLDLMTTVGKERRVNEALTVKTKDDFVRYMTEGWPPKPQGWEDIVEANNRG